MCVILCLFFLKQLACAETEGNVDNLNNVGLKNLEKPNLRSVLTGSPGDVLTEDQETTHHESCSTCSTPSSPECAECEIKCPESCNSDDACPKDCVFGEECKGDDCSGDSACDVCEKGCGKEQTESSEKEDAKAKETEDDGTQIEQDPLILTQDPEEAQRIILETYGDLKNVENQEESVLEENDEGDDQIVDENGEQQEEEDDDDDSEEDDDDEEEEEDDDDEEGKNTLVSSNDSVTNNSENDNTKTEDEDLVEDLMSILKEDGGVDPSLKVLAQDVADYLNNMDEGNEVA